MAGGMIGPVSAFLQCVGFYHIVLITDDSMKTLALVAFLFSCFGIIAGGAYHNDCAYLGLLGKDRFRDALAVVEAYFQKLPLLYYAGMGIGFPLYIIWLCCSQFYIRRTERRRQGKEVIV
jgi:hypothetical protein